MRIFITTLLLSYCALSFGQNQFYSFTDFHIHPTYKHYNRPKTAEIFQTILRYSSIDTNENKVVFLNGLEERFRDDNWTLYPLPNNKKKNKDLRAGYISNLRNYDQASYAQLGHTPGSILCSGFYPFEKQYATSKTKIWINSKLVTKMGKPRVTYYGSNEFTPFNDFMVEYYYTLLQDTMKYVNAIWPTSPYFKKNSQYATGKSIHYWNITKLVKDNAELTSILAYNDSIFKLKDITGQKIYTPVLMSIEGGQVFYGPLSGHKDSILKPHIHSESQNEEILKNAVAIKRLPHRLFFVMPGHFAQNHVVGFAKTIDRDPENFQHRIPAMLSALPWLRNTMLFPKNYSGFNERDGLGRKVVRELLNPHNTKHGKPTYIDVKHMDIKGRIQYYYMRREFEKDFERQIPIIASHFGVSGENQVLAAATGLWPNFDRYRESEDPRDYYYRRILREEDPDKRKTFWENVMTGNGYSRDHMSPQDMRLYKPLNFHDTDPAPGSTFDPFINYSLDSNKAAGWFYNWSLNLFDDEIIEISKSDGIIGLLLDPRQLGAFAPNYSKKYLEETRKQFCSNNPINSVDPNGLTDFTLNRKTGEIQRVGEENDHPDRILKTKRNGDIKTKNGKVKVAIDNVEKGILKDGINFQTSSHLIAVGGEGQPTVEGVESFVFKLSAHVAKEIGGTYFSRDGASETTHMTIGQYQFNDQTHTNTHGHNLGLYFQSGDERNKYKLRGFFHTHPTMAEEPLRRLVPSQEDLQSRNNGLRQDPFLKYFLLTQPENYGEASPFKKIIQMNIRFTEKLGSTGAPPDM